MNKIKKIVETLRVRGENPEYIISYLTEIITQMENTIQHYKEKSK